LKDRPPCPQCKAVEKTQISDIERQIDDGDCLCRVQTLLYGETRHGLSDSELKFLRNMNYRRGAKKEDYSQTQRNNINRIYDKYISKRE
jgi:hypothetical protein